MGMVSLWDCKSSGSRGMKRRYSIRHVDSKRRRVGTPGIQTSRELSSETAVVGFSWILRSRPGSFVQNLRHKSPCVPVGRFQTVVRICTVVEIYSRRHRGQLLRPASVGAWASLAHIRLLSRNVVHFLFAQRAELLDTAEKSIVAKVKRRFSDRGCVLCL